MKGTLAIGPAYASHKALKIRETGGRSFLTPRPAKAGFGGGIVDPDEIHECGKGPIVLHCYYSKVDANFHTS